MAALRVRRGWSHSGPRNLLGEGRIAEPDFMPRPPADHTADVVEHPANDRRHRRRFSGKYKTRILAKRDACTARGEVAALLRKESPCSSQLTEWRKPPAHTDAGLKPPSPNAVGRNPARDERPSVREA